MRCGHARRTQCTHSGHAVHWRRASASLHRACSLSLVASHWAAHASSLSATIAANLASLAASSSCRLSALAARCRARAAHASVSASCHPPGARRASTWRATAACVSAASSARTSLSTAAATARCRNALCAVPSNPSSRSPLAASSRAYTCTCIGACACACACACAGAGACAMCMCMYVHVCACACCACAVHTSQRALHICLSTCLTLPVGPSPAPLLQLLCPPYSSPAHLPPHLSRLGSQRVRHKAGAVQRRLFGRRGACDADVSVGGGLALDASVERTPPSIRTHIHLQEVGRFRAPRQLIYPLSSPTAYCSQVKSQVDYLEEGLEVAGSNPHPSPDTNSYLKEATDAWEPPPLLSAPLQRQPVGLSLIHLRGVCRGVQRCAGMCRGVQGCRGAGWCGWAGARRL